MKESKTKTFSGSSLNTLAQTETTVAIVLGNGSDLSDPKVLQGRAKRKLVTQKMVLSLIGITEKAEDSERLKSYWNTFYCQSNIYTFEGRLYGKYCKNRFCTLCCSIRKAKIINAYLPIINQWDEPYFVTLTAKAIKSKNLKRRMKDLNRGFRKINARYRKRALRGKGPKLIGIKSLECNFNPIKLTYNPHMHVIVASKEMAEIIIKEWLEICTPKFAIRKAQHLAKISDKQRALVEVVKYGSKIFTEPGTKENGIDGSIFTAALDNIFVAMKGCRIFERFGFNLPKNAEIMRSAGRVLNEFDQWAFDLRQCDWMNVKNDQVLSGYIADPNLSHILNNCINVEIQ